jgi:hypothetical protein
VFINRGGFLLISWAALPLGSFPKSILVFFFAHRLSPLSAPYQLQRQLLIGGPERFGGVAGNRLVKLTFEAI